MITLILLICLSKPCYESSSAEHVKEEKGMPKPRGKDPGGQHDDITDLDFEHFKIDIRTEECEKSPDNQLGVVFRLYFNPRMKLDKPNYFYSLAYDIYGAYYYSPVCQMHSIDVRQRFFRKEERLYDYKYQTVLDPLIMLSFLDTLQLKERRAEAVDVVFYGRCNGVFGKYRIKAVIDFDFKLEVENREAMKVGLECVENDTKCIYKLEQQQQQQEPKGKECKECKERQARERSVEGRECKECKQRIEAKSKATSYRLLFHLKDNQCEFAVPNFDALSVLKKLDLKFGFADNKLTAYETGTLWKKAFDQPGSLSYIACSMHADDEIYTLTRHPVTFVKNDAINKTFESLPGVPKELQVTLEKYAEEEEKRLAFECGLNDLGFANE